jgi:hypothetical protein
MPNTTNSNGSEALLSTFQPIFPRIDTNLPLYLLLGLPNKWFPECHCQTTLSPSPLTIHAQSTEAPYIIFPPILDEMYKLSRTYVPQIQTDHFIEFYRVLMMVHHIQYQSFLGQSPVSSLSLSLGTKVMHTHSPIDQCKRDGEKKQNTSVCAIILTEAQANL